MSKHTYQVYQSMDRFSQSTDAVNLINTVHFLAFSENVSLERVWDKK